MPEIIPKGTFFMSMHVGDIEGDSNVESVSQSMQGSPIIDFKDGSHVAFKWKELIQMAIAEKEKSQE